MRRATRIADGLPDVAACDDVEALGAAVPPPADEATRTAVAAVRETIARAAALERAGKYADAIMEARVAVDAGAAIDYAPLREKWFVLSGVRNGTAFYQRVTFSCGGRKINSWAMLFPEGQKAIYEPIIEQVHRSFSVSDRNCG
jgi:hypothetical protein